MSNVLKYKFDNNDKNYTVKITEKISKKYIIIKIKNLRAYIALKHILQKYPDYLNSHDENFEREYKDTNRAIGALRKEEYYDNFLLEKTGERRVKNYKFNIDKLFEIYDSKTILKVSQSTQRISISDTVKKELIKKQNGRCNITGYKLKDKIDKKSFMSNSLRMVFDHRQPLTKNGSNNPDKIDNWQIISELVNQEKLKVCTACSSNLCENCALAFPENYKVVLANNQRIDDINKNK